MMAWRASSLTLHSTLGAPAQLPIMFVRYGVFDQLTAMHGAKARTAAIGFPVDIDRWQDKKPA